MSGRIAPIKMLSITDTWLSEVLAGAATGMLLRLTKQASAASNALTNTLKNLVCYIILAGIRA